MRTMETTRSEGPSPHKQREASSGPHGGRAADPRWEVKHWAAEPRCSKQRWDEKPIFTKSFTGSNAARAALDTKESAQQEWIASCRG